jgi:hypothetical protein
MSRTFALFLLSTSLILAQTSTGSITGVVSDSSGAVVPGATVRLIGTDTGDLARELTTAGDGSFSAPLLRPSTYTVEVSATGFKRLVRSGIVLRVDDTLTLRLTLEPGTVTDSVTVTASAELLEERTNTLGQVIDDRSIQQLPLNGRNYLELGNLTAGAVPSTRSRDRSFSAYGNRGLQNAFLLDGARNQNYLRGLDNRARDAMRPSLEAISEFKVQTSNYSAEYGASAGAVVNVVTRSGTNQFHGSAFEFLRNNALDARDYFLPATSDQPLFIQHQFGGSLGGPIVRNRAWFHGAYQRTHLSEGDTGRQTVPLPSELSGQFRVPVYDPYSTRPNPSGAGFVRDIFPANSIPASRFDRVGRSVAERYPAPNLAGVANNYFANPLQATRINNATFRGDFRLSDKDNFFGRYSFDNGMFSRLPILPPGAQTPVNREIPARSWGIGYTRIIGPTMVNELRVAYNFTGVIQDSTLPRDEVVAGSLDPRVNSSIPTFSVTGYAQIGGQPAGFGNVPLDKQSKVTNISDNFTWVRGKHTIRTGFDFQYIDVPTFAALQGRGNFGFTGVFSQNPLSRPGTGNPVADLLLGLPNQITVGTPSDAKERAANYYAYVQDDWNVTPTLTLNLGVRYEVTSPFYDANNRLANIVLDPGPLFGQYVLAGDPRLPRALMALDRNNWAPRAGFAWRARKTLVVRGGGGIFFAQDEGLGVSQRMTNNPPFVGFGGYNIISDQLNPSSTIALSGQLPPRPAPINPKDFVLQPGNTLQIRSWPTRNTIPYVAQWNLSIQKELPGNILWEVNYVGNSGVKLYGAYEGNQPLPGPGGVNARRPLRSITSGSILAVAPWVNSKYHGLSTRVEKRFSGGFNFLGVYTWGRALDMQTNVDLADGAGFVAGFGQVMDAYNRRLNYGLGDHHVAHRFVLNGLWELPFGRGKPYLTSGAGSWLLGGWALSGITTVATGPPLTITLNFDNSNTGNSNRPDRLANGAIGNPTVERWFDTSAFAAPAQFTHGSAGRNILTAPGTVVTDLSVQRNFPMPLGEASRLEFRAEAFNAFNTPQLGIPGTTLGTPNFGIIGATARANRQIQFGLRLLF